MMSKSHPHTAILALAITVILWCAGHTQTTRIALVRGNNYESEASSQTLDTRELKRLVFKATGNISGLVALKASRHEHVLNYSEQFKAESLEEAERFSNYVDIEVERVGDDLVINAVAKYDAPWQGTDMCARLEIEMVLPESISVDLGAKQFDMTVTGPFSTVDISNEYGRIKVSDITDKLKLDSENSRITLANLTGDIEVSTSNNPIRAREIDTRQWSASFNNEYGEIEISDFSGVLECVTSYAAVDLSGIRLREGMSRISTSYGSIDVGVLEMQGAQLYLEDNFSGINLDLPEDVESEFNITVEKGGRIYLTGIPVFPVEIDSDRLIARTENPDSRIVIKISGIGAADIKGRKIYGGP